MKTLRTLFLAPLAFSMFGLALPLFGQAPSLLWTKNIGGRVFAADSQTNVYMQANTSVIKVSGDGIPLQTNSLSIYPGVAQRDTAGNFCYAGKYPGTPSGTFVCYNINNTTNSFFLAKFDPTGSLLWS